MKSSKAIKIIIIGLILAVIILVFYYHISNTAKSKSEEEVQPTVVQNVLMKDLERTYPPSPKEVLKYYSEITKCFYNEEYTEEELEALAMKIQELYDEELIAKQDWDSFLASLKAEIESYKEKDIVISSAAPASSTDVDYYTYEGRECANIRCAYTLREKTSLSVVNTTDLFSLLYYNGAIKSMGGG